MSWSRRSFMGAGPALVIWGCSDADPEGGQHSAGATELGLRRPLSEPGPMIPPVPAIILSMRGRDGDPDELSVLWTFVVNGSPPQVGVSAGEEHLARRLLDERSEFVLNVPTASMMEAFDTIDMNSGTVGDKYTLSGLTRGEASSVQAPTVEEAPIHCECRIIGSLEVPPVRKIFVAEVVATTVREGAVDDGGRLLVDRVPFFGMTAGSGEHYTMGQRVGNIGMTVGRTDIKY